MVYMVGTLAFEDYLPQLACCTEIHTETVFDLVWLNQFTETDFEEPLAFTLFIWNRFRLHVIMYWPVEY